MKYPVQRYIHCVPRTGSAVARRRSAFRRVSFVLGLPARHIRSSGAVALAMLKHTIVGYHLKTYYNVRPDLAAVIHKPDEVYNGIFPCFFFGSLSTLLRSIRRAWITFKRVSLGRITSST